MQVGFLQFRPVRQDVNANITQILSLLDPLSFDLMVLPELANTGYMYESKDALARYSEPADGSGHFISALVSLCRKKQACILSGFAEISADALYNSAVAVSADGKIGHYRKVHLYNTEKSLFLPGDFGFPTFSYQGVKIGMMICFDWIFPEAARTLALSGAQIIAHPANLVTPYCQAAMITRSIENRVFTITANRYGTESLASEELTFTGNSQAISPTGVLLAKAEIAQDRVIIVDIDPLSALDKQFSENNHLFDDRKPRLYY